MPRSLDDDNDMMMEDPPQDQLNDPDDENPGFEDNFIDNDNINEDDGEIEDDRGHRDEGVEGQRGQSGRSQLRSRPTTATSLLFQADQSTNGYNEEYHDPTPTPPAQQKKKTVKMVKFVLYLVILLAVVAMCIFSAFMSIITLLQTKDIPATTYKQEKQQGNHKYTGIIFMAKGLNLISCKTFNFTSLNIDELFKRERCNEKHFTLHYYDVIDSELEGQLHEMLRYIRREQSQLTVVLVKGPADWSNKQTTISHITVPMDQSGAWGIIHPDYDQLSDQFAASSFPGAMTHLKWDLTQNLLVDGFSMNLISSNFRTLFLMSENIFMDFGNIDAIRFELEISLMESNETALDIDASIRKPDIQLTQVQHIEALYQWKDNFYMEGDSLWAVTVWAIVTVVSSALLMIERGYNTLMKAWNQAKPKPKPKSDTEALVGANQQVPGAANASADSAKQFEAAKA
ncbi:uncharacterized protein LOC142353024 [Convolutriloba macropyga]|uniref:uncharacterized protein LOC142353024 n=1 Tax=Convolutriloba macropyga TaxID=536237 RepID=UPI003F520C2F